MTAADVKAALRRRHGCEGGSGEWVCIEEAFSGWQSAGGGVDLLAIGAWRSAKAPGLPGAGRRGAAHSVVSYEVKVSRSDYAREVNGYQPGPNTSWRTRPVPPWPAKAQFALERSHYFMFATPRGLLKPWEIKLRARPEAHLDLSIPKCSLWLPPEAGLLEVDTAGRCHVVVPAVRTEARAFTVPETAELLRHGIDPNRERRLREQNATLRQQVEWQQKQLERYNPLEAL